MTSFKFPDMLSNTHANIINDYEATISNLKLLLYSDKYSLLGDPYFGTNLKRMLFNQNGQVLYDLVIDEIYMAIVTFMPQIRIDRNDISIDKRGKTLYLSIRATNMVDYTTNLYEIDLITME